ncbi:uncharacterized protein LOC107043551 [Diachasma alloeum]|uniref:uncharacterized protein LOC107043551 n=1 Tax=Diachasma alloeum TaxID=454923 RepID=UPI000738214D|nr:uncharacterized protein LOC107043551 [Diachasma alloeum]
MNWWHGPPWLMKSSSSWPSLELASVASADLEEKPGVILSVKVQRPEIWDLVHRYSSLSKLLRIKAICQRVIARLRRIPGSSLATALNPGDIEQARLLWRFWITGEFYVLKFAQLDCENKHQIIIPRDSHLIIRDAHLRTLHGGTQLTLGQLRRSYWILGGKAPVRSFILKCVPCARQRGIRAQQLIGQLPVARLSRGRAFLNTAVDYAGLVSLRSWKGRGHKSYKGWLAIFVCMTTSVVHLEVVSDYSAEGFISAYRRFVARRGLCRNLFSDCGTNFLRADKELRKLFSIASQESDQLARLLLDDGTKWSFNPPSAPYFGGKWEAAALTALPEPPLNDLNIARLSRWQLIQQKVQGFWKWWSTSYLQHLQSISNWHHPTYNVKVGSLVLLTDERFPPTKWLLARVIALHPGRDGLTRVVTIKTSSSTLQRPISKLALLPVSTNDV